MANKTIEIDVKVDSSQAVKGVDDLSKSTDKLNKSTEKTTKSNEDLSSSLGGVGVGFGAAASGAKAFGKQLLVLLANPIGLIIAGIATAVLAVKSAFTSSEAGQNKYAKLMGVIGSVLGNLSDKLSDFGEAIIEVFENPMVALENFGKSLKENIVNRFEGLLEFIPKMGDAIKSLFEGDFAKASQIAFDAVSKVTTGVENMTEKIQEAAVAQREFIEELEREAKIAGEIADKRASADKIERGLIVERAKADRKIVELRAKAARQDLFSLQERKDALIEASEINEAITNKEIIAAQLRASAIIAENKLSKSTKEDLEAEEQAKARVIILETKKLNLQKRLGTELSAINLQQEALNKKEEDNANKKLAKAEEVANKQIELEIKSIQKGLELKRNLKKQLAEEGLDDPNKTPEEVRAAAEELRAVNEEIRAAELEGIQVRFEEDLISQEERDALTLEANKKNSDAIVAINQKEAASFEATEKAKQEVRQYSLNAALDGLNSLAKLDEDNKALQAASLIASNVVGIGRTIQSTVVANAKAAAISPVTGGQPFVAINTASAALGIASSIKATADGLKALGKGGSAGSPPSLPSGGGGSASAPSINEDTLFSTQNLQGQESENVGEGAGINQIKAVVVESDITNVQKKINDIETTSEIG